MRAIDQEICALLKERKIGGMELLFKEYYKPLVVWSATFLNDTQRAEDVVQDFFVKLWEKSLADKLLPDTLKSYLFTSVRNLSLNQLDKIDPLARACDVACYESRGKNMIVLRRGISAGGSGESGNYLPARGRSSGACI